MIVLHAGTSPGDASQIIYTIDANIPGTGIVRMEGQRPLDSYPDGIDVIARANGRGVHGMIVGSPYPDGEVQWDFTELLAFDLCPGVIPPPGLMALMLLTGGNSPTNPTNPGGTGTAPGPGGITPGPGAGGTP